MWTELVPNPKCPLTKPSRKWCVPIASKKRSTLETMNAIDVTGLTRNFNDLRAVNNISFAVEVGEIFGFLGHNGAGKTTTIRMRTGQLRPTAGQARVAGCDTTTEQQRLKPLIGVVSEHQNLYERMS